MKYKLYNKAFDNLIAPPITLLCQSIKTPNGN